MVSIVIVGRLTKDSELKYVQSGDPILSFSVATDRRAKKGNEWVKEPSYWTCTLWGKRGESLAQFMSKGAQVAVTGEAYEDSWEKDNVKHTRVTATWAPLLINWDRLSPRLPHRVQVQYEGSFTHSLPFFARRSVATEKLRIGSPD